MECAVRNCHVRLLVYEGKAGNCTIRFSDYNAGNGAFGRNCERELWHAIFLSLRLTGEHEAAIRCRCNRDTGQFFFKLRMAKQEAQWRAKIVELFRFDALDLRGSSRIKTG